MADKEKNKGMERIGDDELDAVAGGMADEHSWRQVVFEARSDGRVHPLANDTLSNAFCPCHYGYKWARSNKVVKNGVVMVNLRGYTDVKCYQCGKTDTGCIY